MTNEESDDDVYDYNEDKRWLRNNNKDDVYDYNEGKRWGRNTNKDDDNTEWN